MTTDFEYTLAVPTPDPDPTPPTGLPGQASDRILMFCRGPLFQGLVGVFAARTEALLASIESIRSSYSLSTAVGAQLDILGGILQRPRYGLDDATYRKVLQIQVELIIPSTATAVGILRIVEIFTESDPVSYSEGDLCYQVGASFDTFDADSVTLLAQLLREATSAGYCSQLSAVDADGLLCDDANAAVADPGFLDDADSAVAGAGTLAWDMSI